MSSQVRTGPPLVECGVADFKRTGASRAPLLFESAKRQRFLAYLAHRGACRLHEALKSIQAGTLDVATPFVKIGLVRREKLGRCVFVSLNDRFDGGSHLNALLRELEPISSFQKLPKRRLKNAHDRRLRVDLSQIFGGNSTARTRMLVALQVLGGTATPAEIGRTMRYPGKHTPVRKALCVLHRNGILTMQLQPLSFSFANGPWRESLRHFLTALNKRLKFQRVEKTPQPSGVRPFIHKVLDYRKPVIAQDQPWTFRPPADGAPLLFQTDARRRVLCALSEGPLPLPQVLQVADVRTYEPLYGLERDGVVYLFGPKRQQVAMIHPAMPARAEFLRILHRFRVVFNKPRMVRSPEIKTPSVRGWKFGPLRFFGTVEQTETLVLLALAKELDATQLLASLPDAQPHYQTIRHFLFKLTQQRVLLVRQAGTLIRYRLNPHFAVAKELRKFLRAIAQRYPKFAANIRALNSDGTQRARALRSSKTAKIRHRPAIDSRAAPQ